jgi:hypothetical protein
MRKQLDILIATPFNIIRSSGELSIMLMRVYSTLYLGGKSPNFCESCQRKYHEEIVKTGIMTNELYEAVKTRTCKPRRGGIVYHSLLNDHINFDLLTDARAIELLKKGILKENDFEVMPWIVEPVGVKKGKKQK